MGKSNEFLERQDDRGHMGRLLQKLAYLAAEDVITIGSDGSRRPPSADGEFARLYPGIRPPMAGIVALSHEVVENPGLQIAV